MQGTLETWGVFRWDAAADMLYSMCGVMDRGPHFLELYQTYKSILQLKTNKAFTGSLSHKCSLCCPRDRSREKRAECAITLLKDKSNLHKIINILSVFTTKIMHALTYIPAIREDPPIAGGPSSINALSISVTPLGTVLKCPIWVNMDSVIKSQLHTTCQAPREDSQS